ncbi:hypothetical protein H1C71_037460 [Ictidomys tridecemlineatus]|nr:hypothetical protein H1C71_037460 [Ictidomys tridecemlineatus]
MIGATTLWRCSKVSSPPPFPVSGFHPSLLVSPGAYTRWQYPIEDRTLLAFQLTDQEGVEASLPTTHLPCEKFKGVCAEMRAQIHRDHKERNKARPKVHQVPVMQQTLQFITSFNSYWQSERKMS